MFFGSSSTTRLFCRIAGDVLKMSAAVTVPSSSARTVAGPPPSLIATKLSGAMSRPYFALSPGSPSVRFRNSDGAPNFTSGECAARSAMVLRFHFCAVGWLTARCPVSSAGDGVRIDRSPGSARSSASSTCVRRGHLGVLVEVLQQVAGVLGNQVDRMVLDRGDVGFAAADAELPADGEAVGLQRLRLDLGDDLGLGEVGGADDDRLEVAGGRSRRRAGWSCRTLRLSARARPPGPPDFDSAGFVGPGSCERPFGVTCLPRPYRQPQALAAL